MAVEPSELLLFAQTVLQQMGIKNAEVTKITYAFKIGNEWHVNFAYKEQLTWIEQQGSFSLNAQNRKIVGMWADRLWK